MRRRTFLGLLGCVPFGCGGRDDVAHSLKPEPIAFVPGMRQDLTNGMAPVGTLSDAKNCRFSRLGGVVGRNGTQRVLSTTHGNVHEIQGHDLVVSSSIGDAPALGTDQGKMFSRDETGALWNFCGNFSTVVPLRRRKGLATERDGTIGTTKYGIAANSAGYVLVASCTTNSSLCVSIESDDGTPLWYENALATATKCLAISQNDVFVLVAQNGTALTAHTFTITDGAIAYNSASVATLQGASQYWDICEGPGSSWYLVYQILATRLDVDRFSTALAFQGTLASITVAGNCPCSVSFDSTNSRVWAGWWNDPGVSREVRLRAWNTSGTALCAVTTLSTGTFRSQPLIGPPGAFGDAFYTFNRFDGAASRVVFGYLTLPANSANTCTVGSYQAWFVSAISKPDANQRSWCVTGHGAIPGYVSGDVVADRNILVRWQADAAIGSSSIELTGPQFENTWFFTSLDQFASVSNRDGLITFALPRTLRIGLSGSSFPLVGLDVYQYQDFTAHPSRSSVKIGNSLVVSGQPTAFYGGSSGIGNVSGPVIEPRQGGVEIGFPIKPEINGIVEQAAGSLDATGTYSYQVVLEWISPSGERHRSRPSDPEAITLTGVNGGVVLTISAPNLGQRWDDAMQSYPVVHVYRTENGGQVHYRVSPGAGATTANSSTGAVTFTDTLSDANMLLAGEALYTDQALCDYDFAPSCRFMWRDEKRVWFGGLWETDQVQCSLDIIPDQPLECSDFAGLNGPAFRISIGEPCTGGAYQDGVNYLFAKSAIYAVSGSGPDRQGNGDFSPPRVITNETGCVDYRSIKATSIGIFFKSERGIELIPRGGGLPVFVGAAIQALTKQYYEVTSVAIHSDSRERTCRFGINVFDSGAALVAVFDLDRNVWSYDEYPQAVALVAEWPDGTFIGYTDQSDTACGLFDERNRETGGDNSVSFNLELTTHWISPFGPGGFGRLNCAQVVFSNPSIGEDLTLSADTVGSIETSSPATKTWTLPATGDGPMARELTIARELSAVRFTVQLEQASQLRSVIHAIAIETQAHQGTRRNSASNQ